MHQPRLRRFLLPRGSLCARGRRTARGNCRRLATAHLSRWRSNPAKPSSSTGQRIGRSSAISALSVAGGCRRDTDEVQFRRIISCHEAGEEREMFDTSDVVQHRCDLADASRDTLRPKLSGERTPTCPMPFRTGRMIVPGPTAGAKSLMARSSAKPLTVSRTTSKSEDIWS